MVKNLPANARAAGLIPGSGRSPGVGKGNLLQYPCLENSMDRGAWLATVHGITKIRAVSTEHSPLQMLSLGLFLSFFLTVFFKKSVYIETDYYLPALWQKFYHLDRSRKKGAVGGAGSGSVGKLCPAHNRAHTQKSGAECFFGILVQEISLFWAGR